MRWSIMTTRSRRRFWNYVDYRAITLVCDSTRYNRDNLPTGHSRTTFCVRNSHSNGNTREKYTEWDAHDPDFREPPRRVIAPVWKISQAKLRFSKVETLEAANDFSRLVALERRQRTLFVQRENKRTVLEAPILRKLSLIVSNYINKDINACAIEV